MLSITKAALGYGEKAVLRFGGLELAAGGQCLITGPSGTGKTTLLYAIAGLARVLEGEIRIDGTAVTALGEAARDRFRGRHIGIVFQTLHLVQSLSVLENLLLASYLAGLPPDRKRALAALDRLEIAHKRDDRPQTLSQGQAQRVAIGRALLHRPKLVLADEPTSSLDDGSAAAAIGLIKDVARETGATLLVSSHDARVKPHFDRVVALSEAA
jgi:ABC-type lipoprotein export system ATPase subunit